MHYPKPLTVGSRIAITAFSSGVSANLHQRLDAVLNGLRQRGFEVIEGQCLRENHHYVSGSAQARAAELMGFLLDDSIDAVAPPWGGELALEILPLLDFQRLRQARPKWIFGYSDVTTVTTVLSAHTGWPTVHSAGLMELHPAQQDPLTAKTLDYLALEAGAEFTQLSASQFQTQFPDWGQDPDGVFNFDAPVTWEILQPQERSLSLYGRLFGGCLDTLLHLLGTPWLDLGAWRQQYAPEGVLLYLENVEMAPQGVNRALTTLKMRGVFEHVNGLLLGRNSGPMGDDHSYHYLDAVKAVVHNLALPVVYDLDIGHKPPNLTLINGALAKLDIADGRGAISQKLV